MSSSILARVIARRATAFTRGGRVELGNERVCVEDRNILHAGPDDRDLDLVGFGIAHSRLLCLPTPRRPHATLIDVRPKSVHPRPRGAYVAFFAGRPCPLLDCSAGRLKRASSPGPSRNPGIEPATVREEPSG